MKIVSLCPSLTELVSQLGLGESLVGRTKFCVHPESLVAGLESVGGTKDPDVERIRELAPDLVLMNAEENRIEDFEALVAAGLSVHTSMPRSVEDAVALVEQLGERLDAEARAAELTAAIHAELQRAPLSSEPVRYAFYVWRKPWMAAGPGTYVDGLFGAVGGTNVALGDAGSYPTLELSDLSKLRCDVVLLSSEPYRFVEKHRAEVAELTGFDESAIRLVDGEACTWHGSRTVAGLQEARRVLARGSDAPLNEAAN